jgi:hypothetical protein
VAYSPLKLDSRSSTDALEKHPDGVISHCGVNSIELLRDAEGWKVTQLSDTRRRDGCPDPLGGPCGPARHGYAPRLTTPTRDINASSVSKG